jgi:hypothetical protein
MRDPAAAAAITLARADVPDVRRIAVESYGHYSEYGAKRLTPATTRASMIRCQSA